MKKRALMIVLLVCAGLLAFAGGQSEKAAPAGATGGLQRIEFDASSPTGGQIVPPTKEIYTFDMMVPDGEHWPGDGVWESIIKEKLNLDIKVKAIHRHF